MGYLRQSLNYKLILIFVFLSLGGAVLYYIDGAFRQSVHEKRISRLHEEQNQVLYQFNSSVENFTTLVSGIKSFIELSPGMPNAIELQKFVNGQLKHSSYNKDLIISFIDTNHTFQFIFTKDSMDPGKLVGSSVMDLRDENVIQELDEMLKTDRIRTYKPLNIREGWLGIPLDFRVLKNGKTIGYIACILNLQIVLDEIYRNFDSKNFILRFSTGEGQDFDRSAIYDNSPIYNQNPDIESYKNFNIDLAAFEYKIIDVNGQKITIGIGFREFEDSFNTQSMLLLGWYLSLVILISISLRQSFNVKRLNKKLKESIIFSNKITELSPSVIYIFDLIEKKTIYENRSIAHYLGYEENDYPILSEFLKKFMHPEDLVKSRERLKQYTKLQDNASVDTIIRVKDAKGDWRWIIGKEVVFSRKSDGTVSRILGITEDITPLKKIELDLNESKLKLKEAQHLSKTAHWEIDLKTGQSIVSEEFHEILGIKSKFEKEELQKKGSYYQRFIHPEDTEFINTQYISALQTGEKYGIDYRIIDNNKDIKHIHSLVNIINDNHKKPITIWGTIQDITERKKQEIALEKAKSMAEMASRAKEDFLSTMSHEIRTPLNAIIGMSHLLIQDSDSEEQTENLNILKFSSENLLVLVNNILDFTKIESENINLEEAPFDFYELINNIRNIFSNRADEKKISLNMIVDNDLPHTLNGDSTRLTQILTNLLGNAIKFTEKGHVKLVVQLIDEDEDEISLAFSVEDTGIGIPLDRQKAIFERFTQAEEETTRKYGGSGLGLAITKRLIELHGQEVHLDSTVGKGSTFRFQLIYKKSEIADERVISTSGQEKVNDIKGVNILVVEDNEINQTVIGKYLKQWHASFHIAGSGADAINMAQKEVFDIVLMDIQMSEMDGYDTTKQLKKMASYRDTPVIALTADIDESIKLKAFEAGMNDILGKPINASELKRKIASHLTIRLKLPSFKRTSATTAISKFIDISRVVKLANGDAKFLSKVMSSYIKELMNLKTTYRVALINNDIKDYRHIKHKTKPTLEMFQATELSKEIDKGAPLLSGGTQQEKERNINSVSGLCDFMIDMLHTSDHIR